MEIVTLTQEMIDDETNSFFGGLAGCKAGDKAVRSDELIPWVDWDLHAPYLIGREKLESWLEAPDSAAAEMAYKKALTLLS
jgi:hypothetical protein